MILFMLMKFLGELRLNGRSNCGQSSVCWISFNSISLFSKSSESKKEKSSESKKDKKSEGKDSSAKMMPSTPSSGTALHACSVPSS